MPQQTTDRAIIHDLLEKDVFDRNKGEEQFFNQYAYFIGQAMHKYSFREDEAFDIYADSVIAAINMIRNDSFEGRSSLKTWMYQIFHHKCVDLVRKKATNKSSINRVFSISDMLLHMADTAKSAIESMIDKTDKELVKEKLKEIGLKCRQVLLQWAEGLSDKEIAVVMKYKNADVVKTSRLRCIEKMRQLYKDHKISKH